MPNTDPPIDDPAAVGFVAAEGRGRGRAGLPGRVHLGGQKGERLAEIGEMVEAGAVAITDDGNPVMDSGLMRIALEYAPHLRHPRGGPSRGPGALAQRRDERGAGLDPARAARQAQRGEDVHILRDMLLAELTGGHIHLQHVSTRFGVEAIRQAKARGVRVTAEATPHHLILTDEAWRATAPRRR
jgi:dihydroorotase